MVGSSGRRRGKEFEFEGVYDTRLHLRRMTFARIEIETRELGSCLVKTKRGWLGFGSTNGSSKGLRTRQRVRDIYPEDRSFAGFMNFLSEFLKFKIMMNLQNLGFEFFYFLNFLQFF